MKDRSAKLSQQGSLGGESDSEALSGYLSLAEDLRAVLVRCW